MTYIIEFSWQLSPVAAGLIDHSVRIMHESKGFTRLEDERVRNHRGAVGKKSPSKCANPYSAYAHSRGKRKKFFNETAKLTQTHVGRKIIIETEHSQWENTWLFTVSVAFKFKRFFRSFILIFLFDDSTHYLLFWN